MAKQENSPLSALISDRDVQTASASDKALKSQTDVGLDESLSPSSSQADLGASAANAAAMSLFFAFDRDGVTPANQGATDETTAKDLGPLPADAKSASAAMPDAVFDPEGFVADTGAPSVQPADNIEQMARAEAGARAAGAEVAPAALGGGMEPSGDIPLQDNDAPTKGDKQTHVPANEVTGSAFSDDPVETAPAEQPVANLASISAISDSDGASDGVMENAANGTVVGVTALASDADGSDSVSYSLSNDAGGRFAIDPTTGVVTVAGAIDRE
ncbi:MAG: cadherin repeat domain-containing protein, partial [Hyphomicrobiales bacterium]